MPLPHETGDGSEIAASQPTSLPHRVFYGESGLRAVWALLLWFAMVWLLGSGVSAVLHAALRGRVTGGAAPEWLTLSTSALGFLVVGIAAWVVARFEGRSWSDYGITAFRGREFGLGAAWGFAMLSLLVLVLWSTGHFTFGGLRLHGANAVLWAAIFACSFLFTGLFEEFTFRGFPQFTLARGMAPLLRRLHMEDRADAVAFAVVALLLGVVFGAVHAGNPGEGRMGLLAAGLIGVVFAYSLWRTGSLWWAIGFHAAWDWAESYFYGTADSGGRSIHRLMQTDPQGKTLYSGGTIGPEGSIFVFVVIALSVLVIALTLKPRPGSPAAAFRQRRYDLER